ncbi:MAG: hypothetical protein Q4D16_03940 [Eubacteriales bacterium]|nr:hypothetical protein [Eubacteriales bacterium]
MLQILCLFFPGCLSMAVYRLVRGKDEKDKGLFDLVMIYGAFAFVDTAIALILVSFFGNAGQTCIQGNVNDGYISMKFMLISIVVAAVVGFAGKVIETYAHYELTVGKKEGMKDEKED